MCHQLMKKCQTAPRRYPDHSCTVSQETTVLKVQELLLYPVLLVNILLIPDCQLSLSVLLVSPPSTVLSSFRMWGELLNFIGNMIRSFNAELFVHLD